MLREPILWFIVVGAFLFAAESYFTTEREVLVVDDGVRNRLASLWQAQMGSPATEQQLGSLIDSWVREEVMLREALRSILIVMIRLFVDVLCKNSSF